MKKIKILKPVTIASVAAENPPRKEFSTFFCWFIVHELKEEITAAEIGTYFEDETCHKSWFISHGFIEEVEEREPIGVGSLWRHLNEGCIYGLNVASGRLVCLNVVGCQRKNGTNYSGKMVEVKDIRDLTDSEWSAVTEKHNRFFTRLHGRMEYVEDKE